MSEPAELLAKTPDASRKGVDAAAVAIAPAPWQRGPCRIRIYP